jgi:site-specific recombinase XerD
LSEKKKRNAKKLPKLITPEDVEKILATFNLKTWMGLRNYTIIYIMYKAGLRVSEVTNQMLEDVDVSDDALGWIFVQQGKNSKDRRLPIDGALVQTLRRWLEKRGTDRGEYFFCTYKGEPLDQRYIREMCYTASKKAGVFIRDGRQLRPVNPHTYRHVCATEMLNNGFTIYEVMEYLGHESITTTQIYLMYNMEALAAKMRQRGTGA